jgi:hypothetical protein
VGFLLCISSALGNQSSYRFGMSITSTIAISLSTLFITSVLVFIEAPMALACSTGGAGSTGVSHGSAMHAGSVTVCVGVEETKSAAPIRSAPKPAPGIKIKPVTKPACPTSAQRKFMPKSPDAAERWVKSVCSPTKPAASKPVTPKVPVSLTPEETTFSSGAASFSPNPLRANVYPSPQLGSGEIASFRSNPSLHFGSQLVIGKQAEVQFTPTSLGWQFSDGIRMQGVDVKRQFEQAGKYQAWAIASYFVSYRLVGETAWQPVAGQISVLSNVLNLDVSVKIPALPAKPPKLLLVGGECSANPGSWGCLP